MNGTGPTGGDERVEPVAQALFDHEHRGDDAKWEDNHFAFAEIARGAYRGRARAALAAADAVAAQDPAPQDGPWDCMACDGRGTFGMSRCRVCDGSGHDRRPAPAPVALADERPFVWIVGDANGGHAAWTQAEADQAAAEGWTVIPCSDMRRRSAPAPVVPDEADQATTDTVTVVFTRDEAHRALSRLSADLSGRSDDCTQAVLLALIPSTWNAPGCTSADEAGR